MFDSVSLAYMCVYLSLLWFCSCDLKKENVQTMLCHYVIIEINSFFRFFYEKVHTFVFLLLGRCNEVYKAYIFIDAGLLTVDMRPTFATQDLFILLLVYAALAG